jgi:photosystem II stability/assembly factor-like uncharacterized protein
MFEMKKVSVSIILLFAVAYAFAQWTKVNPAPTSNNLYSVHFPVPNVGFAVGDTGTILKTNDSGTTWLKQTSGTSALLISVCFLNAETGYAVGGSGTILKTINGGTTWTKLQSGTTKNLNSVKFTNPQTGYVVGDSGTLMKTSNGGITWTANHDYSQKLTCVFFVTADTGFVTGYGGTIIKTVDGGQSWFPQYSGTSRDVRSVFFTDSDIGFAVVFLYGYILDDESSLLKTHDGGTTWKPIGYVRDPLINSIFFTDASTGYLAGQRLYRQNGYILKTTYSGVRWDTTSVGQVPGLSSIFFTDANTGYAVGGSGTILKTTNGGIYSINEVASTHSNLSIKPNPAMDKIWISNSSDSSGEIKIAIYDLQGKQLIIKVYHNQSSVEMDISALNSGIYLIKLQTIQGVEVKKLLVTK